jgi:hypothetical protein
MKIPSNILHDKQYADKILEITADTMFFVYKDGTCLDFKANTTDFFIKEQDIIGRNIFSYFPVETAREMYAEFIKVRAGDKPSARNYKLILEDDVKYYKCIISKYDEEHFLFQYRDITGRSVVRLKLEKKQKDLCEVEKAARIGLWAYDSSTRLFTYSGYTRIFCNDEEQKQISIDEYMNYMHLDDKDRFSQWLEENLKEKDASNTVNYRLLIDGKTVNMRIKTYHKEVYMQRTVLEGYWWLAKSCPLLSLLIVLNQHFIKSCTMRQNFDGTKMGQNRRKIKPRPLCSEYPYQNTLILNTKVQICPVINEPMSLFLSSITHFSIILYHGRFFKVLDTLFHILQLNNVFLIVVQCSERLPIIETAHLYTPFVRLDSDFSVVMKCVALFPSMANCHLKVSHKDVVNCMLNQ